MCCTPIPLPHPPFGKGGHAPFPLDQVERIQGYFQSAPNWKCLKKGAPWVEYFSLGGRDERNALEQSCSLSAWRPRSLDSGARCRPLEGKPAWGSLRRILSTETNRKDEGTL